MNPYRPHRQPLRFTVLSALLAGTVALSGASAFAQIDAKASKFYEDALVRYEKRDMPGAIIQLKNALQVDPKLLPVQLLLGKALLRNGEIVAAEVALNEALRLGVNRGELVVLLGQIYLAQGKHKEMLEARTFQLAGLPDSVRLPLSLLRATAHADLGDTINAMRAIEEARALDSRSADAWIAEVPIRIRARQFKEAIAAVDKGLALAPNSAEAWYQKASILHVQGDLRGALALYDKALDLKTDHIEARVARGGVYLDLGRFADAAKDLVELQKVAPGEPRGAYLRALLAERSGDATASRAGLKEVTELLDPVPLEFIRYRPQLLMLNGLAHFGLNQGEKAKQYLEAFQRVQNNSPASKLLARIYLADGNATQAVSVLETYLRSQPGDGQALTLLASGQMALGRYAKATALMQDALKAQDNPAFRTSLGLSLVGNGQTASGIIELESAYRVDPKQTQAATALIKLYLRENQASKALPIVERLVKDQPGDASVLNMLGLAQAQLGKADLARSAFEKAVSLDTNSTAAKINLARIDIATKAYEAATRRLNDILKVLPNNSECMFELSVIAEQRGNQNDAQRWLEKARDAAGPKDPRWDLELVDFHLRYGRPAQALDAAKLASAKSPEDLKALLTYSRAQLAAGDTVSAKNLLTSATRFAEYDAGNQYQIAVLQLAANNPAGAAYSLNKALSSNPDFLPAQALMTEVELRQGEPVKAEKRARDIVTQYPKLSIGHSLLGDVAMAKNQAPVAIDAYSRAHKTEPTSSTALKLFRALLSQESGKPAFQLAHQWIKAHPTDLPMQKALADGYARSGDLQAARPAYEAALKVAPNDADLLNNLANVQLRLKDIAGAISSAERALAQAPGSALIIDTLGWALFHNGNLDRALQLLRDARLRRPGNAEIRYHLAAVLAQTGRKSEAKEELDVALKSGNELENVADARKLMLTLN